MMSNEICNTTEKNSTNQVSVSKKIILQSCEIASPIGDLVAIADEKSLFALEFRDHLTQAQQLKLEKTFQCNIITGNSAPLTSIKEELEAYFAGELKQFKTPLAMHGTNFQKQVWQELIAIPHGKTRSYLEMAKAIGNPLGCRAVARANSTNRMAIVIPCHRVINHNGALGGYAGGISRKQWLLDHEKNLSH